MPTTVVNLKGHRDDPDYADVAYVGRAVAATTGVYVSSSWLIRKLAT